MRAGGCRRRHRATGSAAPREEEAYTSGTQLCACCCRAGATCRVRPLPLDSLYHYNTQHRHLEADTRPQHIRFEDESEAQGFALKRVGAGGRKRPSSAPVGGRQMGQSKSGKAGRGSVLTRRDKERETGSAKDPRPPWTLSTCSESERRATGGVFDPSLGKVGAKTLHPIPSHPTPLLMPKCRADVGPEHPKP